MSDVSFRLVSLTLGRRFRPFSSGIPSRANHGKIIRITEEETSGGFESWSIIISLTESSSISSTWILKRTADWVLSWDPLTAPSMTYWLCHSCELGPQGFVLALIMRDWSFDQKGSNPKSSVLVSQLDVSCKLICQGWKNESLLWGSPTRG